MGELPGTRGSTGTSTAHSTAPCQAVSKLPDCGLGGGGREGRERRGKDRGREVGIIMVDGWLVHSLHSLLVVVVVVEEDNHVMYEVCTSYVCMYVCMYVCTAVVLVLG